MIRWLLLLIKHLLLVGLCVWALYVQWAYRVPGSAVFVFLPWIGVGLTTLTLLVLVGQVLRRAPPDDPLRRLIHGIEQADSLLILAFCFYSLFLFTNARMASGAAVAQASDILAIGGGEPDAGLTNWYGWADLRSWRDPGRRERLLLYDGERRTLWGGQAVLVDLRRGFFNVPWVAKVEPDEERRLRVILKVTPTASQVWKDLANLQFRRGRHDEALATALEYLKVYPDDDEFAVRLAGDFYSADLWPSAVPLLEPFLTRKPTFQIYRFLGFAMTRAGRQGEGVALIKKAIALEPDEWWSYYVLAYAYFYNGELREAEPWFEKLLELRPDFPEIEGRLRAIRGQKAGR